MFFIALASLTLCSATLLPLAWIPLPYGTVRPQGWLLRQLQIQGAGLSGNFENFWAPVSQSTWTGGSNKEEDFLEIWPYVFAGYVPQAILLNDTAQLAQSALWIDYLLTAQAATGTGWLGPAPELRDPGMLYWPQWPIVLTFMAWREYTASTGAEDPRLVAASLAWLHNASGMLQQRPMGRDWSGTRWQDFLYAIQVVQDCPSTPASEQPFLAALAATAYTQGITHGIDWASYYTPANFPQSAVSSWDYLPHGVNNAMAAKGGAVSWRAGLDATGNASSWARDALLMTYHGSPSGIFQADECLAGAMPSKASETCLVVEQLLSLNIVHEVQGDAHFAERAERIAYNALPATGTKDMWSRVYLQQANEVYAGHSHSHPWATDGEDATTYSLDLNYDCCTANFNQGWPRFVQKMLHASPDGGLALSLLGPVAATLPGGVGVSVSGDYPFEDDLTITLSGLPAAAPLTYPLYLRIPAWAVNASLTINGGAEAPVGAANGTMLKVLWPQGTAGPAATLLLRTYPAIRTERQYNGALAVLRGALLYSLRLDETFEVTATAAGEPRAANYLVTQPGCDMSGSSANNSCTAPWNVALVLAAAQSPGGPLAGLQFTRTGPTPPTPFAAGLWGGSNLEITAHVRGVGSWGVEDNAAAPPPASPVDCDSAPGLCTPPYPATLVPYGATHLRMAVLPWTLQPPCGQVLGWNASSGGVSALPGGDFSLCGGAEVVPNGNASDLRSGDPGENSTAVFQAVLLDSSRAVTGLQLSYQYVAGYGGAGAPGGAVLQVVASVPSPCGACGQVLQVLYTSPPLEEYPFDVCQDCYSPPMPVSLPRGSFSLNATAGLALGLRFVNNQRNVQVKMPIEASVLWG